MTRSGGWRRTIFSLVSIITRSRYVRLPVRQCPDLVTQGLDTRELRDRLEVVLREEERVAALATLSSSPPLQ